MVIHAVGPVYSGPQDEALLASAYKTSLARATRWARPAWPSAAARVSVDASRSAHTSVQHVFLVALGEETAGLWEQALSS